MKAKDLIEELSKWRHNDIIVAKVMIRDKADVVAYSHVEPVYLYDETMQQNMHHFVNHGVELMKEDNKNDRNLSNEPAE